MVNFAILGLTSIKAQQYLNMTNYSVPDAVGAFYQAADQSEPSEGDADDDALDNDAPEPVRGPAISAAAPSGGRRLGEAGDPVASAAPPSAASASQRVQPSSQQKKRLMSLRDLQADGSAGQGRGPAGDGGDDSDKEQEFYAGGDKSGLAVQDPSASGHRDQIQRLMQTARRCVSSQTLMGAPEWPLTRRTEEGDNVRHRTKATKRLLSDEPIFRDPARHLEEMMPRAESFQLHKLREHSGRRKWWNAFYISGKTDSLSTMETCTVTTTPRTEPYWT